MNWVQGKEEIWLNEVSQSLRKISVFSVDYRSFVCEF